MFTWICPQCGREVPPSYDECPDCAARQKATAAAPAPPGAEPPKPAAPVQPDPPRVAPAQPPPAPERKGGLPTWLMSILFALGFIALGLGLYWTVGYFRGRSDGRVGGPHISMENPPARNAARPHPLQRYIEVAGIRFIQDAKKNTEARFVVVNHSPDDIGDLAGNVTIWGRTQKSEEESVGTFTFKIASLGPWESKDVTAQVNTKLRVYELPDWQNITTEVQLTAP